MTSRPPLAHVTDHANLRWLERGHGLDVEAVRRHLAGKTINGVKLGAIAVVIDGVKLVLKRSECLDGSVVTTVIPRDWPTRTKGE